MIFHCPFTDIETLGDFVIRQTFLTAHLVYFASLGRHALDRTVDDRLQLADEQGFFLLFGLASILQVFVRLFFRDNETVEIVVHGKTRHLQ